MAPSTSENQPADTRSYLPSASTESAGTDATLSDALTTIRKRKYVVMALAVLGLIYGFYKGSTQPRLYESSGRIEIRSGSSNQYRLSSAMGENSSSGNSHIPTEVAILQSDTLLFTVAQDLDLADNPDFLGLKQRPPHADLEDPAVREAIVVRMRGAITVAGIAKTDLIAISCRTLNPRLSADIVNKLIDEYITRSFVSRVRSTQRVSDFLTKQLDDLKQQVETSQEQVIDLGKRLGVLALDPTHSEITASLEALTTAVGQAEIARILAESRYRVLANMDTNAVDETIANGPTTVAANGTPSGAASPSTSELTSLRTQRSTAEADLAKNTAPGGLGPNHPQVKADRAQIVELTKQIQVAQNRVVADAKETYIAALANENQTRGVLEAEKTEANTLRDPLIEYTIQQREFDSERTLYEGLLERLRTASVQAGLESTEIDIIDPAMPSSQPSLERRSVILMVNTLVATLLGIILAFILESLDSGLRSVADIEAVSGLPSLALIPRARRAGVDVSNLSVAERNIGSLSAPKSQFTEAFRALRTSLLLSTAGSLPRVILLTSATPAEGKTTVCTNLACVMAQNHNVRVLMIDGDLRRPTIHHRLGLNGKIGLTSVLTGTATLDQAVQTLQEIPNLDILVSGPVPPFPTEMLGSQTMKNLLQQCRGIYTHIVIDSPPLLSVTDGVILAQDADAVVLIVRHGKSGKQTVRRARDLLVRSGAPVTGVAINAVDLSSPEYYGYYGYSTYAGYGAASAESSAWVSKSEKGDRS